MDWLKKPLKYVVAGAGVGVVAYYAYHKIVKLRKVSSDDDDFSYSHLMDNSFELNSTPSDSMLPDAMTMLDDTIEELEKGNFFRDDLVHGDLGQSSTSKDDVVPDKKECKKILLLGLERSGKSRLLAQLSRNMKEDADYIPTKGYNVVCISHDTYDIGVWEIGGCPMYRVHWRKFCTKIDLVLFVIDASDEPKFPQAKEYIFEIVTELEDGVDFHIVASKTDNANAVSVEQLEDILGVKRLKIPIHSVDLENPHDNSSVQTLINCCLAKYSSS